ncbi:MAG: 16S rRNA (cytosine(967)-C(5))-methyltransferase [Cyanothece sp. SIO1E1]|nr:16S rRNA (cytosine(967)-C(5))-methyltransferase [Cyanothece sp. SIO1E1]
MTSNPRQVAFWALKSIQDGAFADIALDRVLHRVELQENDRRLATELVYGSVRRRRTLDALIDQLGRKPVHQQPPNLRLILHLGLYQLRYLSHIPAHAVVDTTVRLAKQNGLQRLAGVVNGVLRHYIRQSAPDVETSHAIPPDVETLHATSLQGDPLQIPTDPIARLGVLHSYPDWIVKTWQAQLGMEETEKLCVQLNQTPHIDLRVNPLRTSITEVEATLKAAGIATTRISPLPQALRLQQPVGPIQKIPGFQQGGWTVQDSSAQLVGHLLNPQPGEVVIDACAAPGGKTTHLAELMGDRGIVWGCDRSASRLKKLQQTAERLQLQSIRICRGDSRTLTQFAHQADRVLIDAPCSGLGTLHRHADARWRQTPETVQQLAQLQLELLNQTLTWLKPGGSLVYATCTLHPIENEALIHQFLAQNPTWRIQLPSPDSPVAQFATSEGWIKVWPHRHQMDGFFMVLLEEVDFY